MNTFLPDLTPWWQLVLVGLSLGVSLMAIHRSRSQQFYDDTPGLWPLGVFVWGDGLILGPFWCLSALLFLWLSSLNVVRYWLLFIVIRSAFEVIYWINHQVVTKEYEPPLFRRVSWLGCQESAILYQLLNTCQVILALMGLLFTF